MRKIAIIRENIEGFKLPFSDLKLEGIQFNYFAIQVGNRDNLDKYFSEILFKVSEIKPEMIFIPCWLGQPLHYLGVRLAMHLRLSSIDDFYEIPIVLMGVETELEFYRNCILSGFLNSAKIFYTSFSSECIITFLVDFEWEKNSKMKINITENLKYFDLTPPANYRSHHSIDNELALLRWSEYLKCDDRIPEVKENLKAGLYFKYHRVLNAVRPFGTGNPYLISGKGKVLLIDDEAEKGWADFYKCFFQHSRQIRFDQNSYLNLDFKSLDRKQIVSKAFQWIKDSDPDVVMLDLRLCDSDFDHDGPTKDLTGYDILKNVKEEINKGIQVIITTASNKVWNYQSTHDHGANGYIIKSGNSDVADDIKNLKQNIETCVERARYLKPAWCLTKSLNDSLSNAIKDNKIDRNFGTELKKILDISIKMYGNVQTTEDFAYAYLALFKSLELISEHFTFIDSGVWQIVGPYHLNQYLWDDQQNAYNSKTPPDFRNGIPSTFEKIAGLCFQLWNYTQADVQQLYYSVRRRRVYSPFRESTDNKAENGMR